MLIEIVEQTSYFEESINDKPYLMPMSAAINLLSHYAVGGTKQEAIENACGDAKRFKISLHLHVTEVDEFGKEI